MALPFTKKMRHLGTTGERIFFCVSLSDLSSSSHVFLVCFFVTEDTGHLLFSAFSWWSLYYVKASVP